jgi:hypothetical protein
MLPGLLQGFANSGAGQKPNFLFAICNMLKHIPKSVLLSELPTVRS